MADIGNSILTDNGINVKRSHGKTARMNLIEKNTNAPDCGASLRESKKKWNIKMPRCLAIVQPKNPRLSVECSLFHCTNPSTRGISTGSVLVLTPRSQRHLASSTGNSVALCCTSNSRRTETRNIYWVDVSSGLRFVLDNSVAPASATANHLYAFPLSLSLSTPLSPVLPFTPSARRSSELGSINKRTRLPWGIPPRSPDASPRSC